jgi:hypothetical protein
MACTPPLQRLLRPGVVNMAAEVPGAHTAGGGFSLYSRVSELLIVLAACFPVLGARIRTLHTASEQRRNAIRFQAKCYAIEKLRKELQRERDAAMIFRLL